MKKYKVNEIFHSLQGEGVRSGTANVFVRFSACNLACDVEPGPKSPGGFACDTEFASGRSLTLPEILEWIRKTSPTCNWLILTGGEPGLQVDQELTDFFHDHNFKLAIETNGSVELKGDFDWITVSPKVAEHAIKQLTATEVKYVRGYGQAVPKTVVTAKHYLISPAFEGHQMSRENLDWSIQLVKENPSWRMSVQQHNEWSVR
jgi:7-carboxy-7-deazaguanine synthase